MKSHSGGGFSGKRPGWRGNSLGDQVMFAFSQSRKVLDLGFASAMVFAVSLVASELATTGFAQFDYVLTVAPDQPASIDLSKHLTLPIASITEIQNLAGRQVFDGLPFQIDGQIHVYGKTPASRDLNYPNATLGVPVGRKFDDLHLVHYTTWPDVEGDTVAYICLDYADDTKFMFPIKYGVHVRDWYNLPSYEREAVSDPDTKICWRRPPYNYKAPIRLFKSTLKNPFPEKTVETMDVISGRTLSAYSLIAATVTNAGSTSQTDLQGDRGFDSKLTLRVVEENGNPIEGALVEPGMGVEDEGVVGMPFRTSANGEGTIPYPKQETEYISVSVSKKGYKTAYKSWSGAIPGDYVIELQSGGVE